jgi:hypothetical protein
MLRLAGVLGALLCSIVVLLGAPAYADGGFGEPDSGGGIPGWFIGFGVLIVLVGIGSTIWRVTTAQKIAKQSGMDPGLATQMTLLTDDGLDATYLAANLRGGQATHQPTQPSPSETTAERLEELKALLDRGLVTQAEYDERRRAIIDSV